MTLVEQLKTIMNQRVCAEAHSCDKIPCNETSDSERLCKNPVVSVVMITYNHEPYIRQAIDSILCQKADFEFELVIGEDCSIDKTREICFEYQNLHPDKVRVLWSDRNLNSIGLSNEQRTIDCCRGEYLAFCEGDDYWTDPQKLQKQVDLIREKKAVMCVAFTDWKYPDGRIVHSIYKNKEFVNSEDLKHHYFHTTTYLICRNAYGEMRRRYKNIDRWTDIKVEFCMATMGRICLLPEIVSVYRWTGTGISTSSNAYRAHLLGTALFFCLYCHGPSNEEAYFVRRALTEVDGLFLVNRRYRPASLTRSQFFDLIKSHAFILRSAPRLFQRTFGNKVEYGLSVAFFLARSLFAKFLPNRKCNL